MAHSRRYCLCNRFQPLIAELQSFHTRPAVSGGRENAKQPHPSVAVAISCPHMQVPRTDYPRFGCVFLTLAAQREYLTGRNR